MIRVVLAVPTIPARAHRLPDLERLWRERTPDADLDIIYSSAGTTWSAGLNDIWQQVRDNPPDLFILGSDDMLPADERWLPCALPWIEQGHVPAPKVSDPRFTTCGGYPYVIAPGTPADMTAFIIIAGTWGDDVFPLPDDLAYFADNLACLKLRNSGHRIVCAPDCRIIHLHAPEGRGFGFGSENTRLYIDTVRYTRTLEGMGIDRASLPPDLRGGMWEERFLAVGRGMGA